jgi:hypothetical protein
MFQTRTAYIVSTASLIMLTALAGVVLAATLYAGAPTDEQPTVNGTETVQSTVTPTPTQQATETTETDTPGVTTDTVTQTATRTRTPYGTENDIVTPYEWGQDNITHVPGTPYSGNR